MGPSSKEPDGLLDFLSALFDVVLYVVFFCFLSQIETSQSESELKSELSKVFSISVEGLGRETEHFDDPGNLVVKID